MTVPIIGHPDWQLIGARRGKSLYGATPLVPAGTTTSLGPFSVDGYAGVAIHAFITAASGSLSLRAGDTNVLNSNEEAHTWTLKLGTSIHVRFPVPRDWIQVDITAGALFAFGMNLDLLPVDIQGGKQYFRTHQSGVNATGVVIPAGNSITDQPQWLSGGPATLWINNTGAPNAVVYEIKLYNNQGVETSTRARWTTIPAAGLVTVVELPETGWILKITNNTAGAITVDYCITPRGGEL